MALHQGSLVQVKKAIENAKKRKGHLRLCAKCKKYVDHDSRNCEKIRRLAAAANGGDPGPSSAGANGADPGPSSVGANGADPTPSAAGP